MLHDPGLLQPESLSPWQATTDSCLHRKHSKAGLAQSLWGLWVLVHTRFCLSPPHIFGRYGVLILNLILPLLPSCWGVSFALGHVVSFFGGIQHSPIDGCLAACCNFAVFAEEDEHTSFYSIHLAMTLQCNATYNSIRFLLLKNNKILVILRQLKLLY